MGTIWTRLRRRRRRLRIVVAGPPKAGNVWVEHLLAGAYALRILSPVPSGDAPELLAFAEAGDFPPGSIFHQHYSPSEPLFEALHRLGAQPVTVLRCPYDAFVSLYHYVQRFPDGFVAANDRAATMIGKPIDHPDVLDFIVDGYGRNLDIALAWIDHADRTILVRYEDLHRDTDGALTALTAKIRKVPAHRLRAAIEASRADVLRTNPGLDRHIRTATIGDSREQLGPPHLEVMRDRHADAVHRMGYEVR